MTIFESVREQISQGDLDLALQTIIAHLKNERKQPETLRALQVLEANYQIVRQKEIKGVIDFNEAQQSYSKITDGLLSIVDDLASGRTPRVEQMELGTAPSNKVYWLFGGGILLLLGLIAGILLRNQKTPPAAGGEAAPASECPAFNGKALTVMLIPFKNLGDRNFNPETAIQTRIQDLTERNNVKSDVRIFPGIRFATNQPSVGDAMETGKNCGAKMVIWGSYEKLDTGISLDVRYVFTEAPNLQGGAIADTFKNLSELKSDQGLFNTLDDAVFALCTMMALHEGNLMLAKQWSEKVKNPSPRMAEIQGMLKKTGK